MNATRTIQVFLASSDELKTDRNTFGNLIRRLDNIYEKRGIRIKLVEWEDCDAAYNNIRKQDEYNVEVRASDMFLALFYKKAGKFTVEEFGVATEEFQRTGTKPKPYVYCRDLPEGEQESEELKEFKRRLFEEMGHYWSQYNNEDSLQLHFVIQLQLVENSRLDNLKVENGEVKLDNTTVARMDHLRFAADNPDFQRMSLRLQELPSLIEKARLRTEKYPKDQDLADELQKLLNEKNQLHQDFERQQQLLLDAAKRIAVLQSEAITDRMKRAIEAFERGNVREANIILDEAEYDALHNLADYRQIKALAEQKRQNVIHSIEELLLKTSTLMADASIDINKRIEKVHSIYSQTDEMAKDVNYDKEKFSDLLFGYAQFLYKYGLYKDSEAIYFRQISLVEELHGTESEEAATSYNNIGAVLKEQGGYDKALEYYFKTLSIFENFLGTKHASTATSYNNIGLVYHEQGNYNKALEYHFKALAIYEKVLGKEHPSTAISYNNIGLVYHKQGNYGKALEYHSKALVIWEKVLGTEHPSTATSYNNIGLVFIDQGDSDMALEYHKKALAIKEKVLGTEHPSTAQSYNNIGLAYWKEGNYDKALEYHKKALAIRENVLGTEHPDTALSYNNIGWVYWRHGNYDMALEYYKKALAIREKVLGTEHPDTALSYNNIGMMYYEQGNYVKALEYYKKALAIREKVLGTEHPDTAQSYNNIGMMYYEQGNYVKALEYYFKDLEICEKVLGTEHPDTATSYNNIGGVYDSQGNYDKALEYYFKDLAIQEKVHGTEHPGTATSYNNIGTVYYEQGDYDKALYYLNKAYQIFEKVLGPEHPNTKATLGWIELVNNTAMENQKPEKKTFWQRLFGK